MTLFNKRFVGWGTTLMAGTLMGLAGFAGNWFRLPLFLSIDILFGGFFVMMALLRYGTAAGIVASIIASSCTLIMWKHPYAMVIFTAETAIVGILNNRRNKSDLLLHDIFYWLVCGAPLVWVFYHLGLEDSGSSTYLIIVKQALNGITNSLLASIFYLVVMTRRSETERPTLRQSVFIVMVSLVLFTACLHVFADLRDIKNTEEQRLADQTVRVTEISRSLVARWLSERYLVVKSLAGRIGDPGRKSLQELQSLLEIHRGTSDTFMSMEVFDKNAVSVAVTPRGNGRGSSMSGSSSAARPYLEQGTPYMSPVMAGGLATGGALVPLLVPMRSDNGLTGFCAGVVKLDDLRQNLQELAGDRPLNIVVHDQSGQVVVSSNDRPGNMTRHEPPTGGTLQSVAPAVDQWIPAPAPGKNLNQRWASSFYRGQAVVSPESRWRVVVENSYGPVSEELRRTALFSLSQLLLLSVIIIPFSSFISFRLTRSLAALRDATLSLPDDVHRNTIPELPDSGIQDIHGLMSNFTAAVLALQEQHQALTRVNRELAATSRDLSTAEERYRTLVEMSPDAVLVLQDGCIVFANRAALAVLGVADFEHLYGCRIVSYIHASDRDKVQDRIQRAVAGEAFSLFDVRGQSLDGREIMMEYVGVPVLFNDRPAAQVILRDITERKRFEDLIRQGKKEWECTFDSVPDLIAILDNQHQIIRVNLAMAEKLGRAPEECVGLTCYEAIHGTESPPLFCPHAMTMSDGRMHESDLDAKIFGGDYLVTTSPLYDQKGEVYASVHMARDISALKKARRIAEESAAELESIFSTIQDAILIIDTKMKIVKVNQIFVSTYGFDPVGYSFQDIVDRSECRLLDGQPLLPSLHPTMRALQGEAVRNHQFLATRADGSEIALETSFMPLHLDDNCISGVVTVWHDITDTLRVQKTLLEKEKRYRTLVEYAPFAVFINRNNLVEYANPATVELFGAVNQGAIAGRSLYDFFHPESHDIMRERIDILLAGGGVPQIESKIVQLDGSIRHAEVVATTFVDDQGVAILVMLHDITRRKQNERAIQRVLERLSLAQISAGAGLWDWDIPMGKLTWSPELFVLFGLDPVVEDSCLKTWQRIVHPDDLTAAEQRLHSAIEKRERLFNEYRVVLPSREIRWISAIGDTIYDADGSPLRMTGICLDITLRRQAEERLNLLADIAEALLAADSPQDAIHDLCAKALGVLDCQLFFNYIVDKGVDRLHLNACSGIAEEERRTIEWLDYGMAVCGCVARDGCRIVAENIAESVDQRTELVKALGVKAYACNPLMIGEEVLGTLSFGSRSRSTFSADDLSLMKAVADLVSIAMERQFSREKLQKAHDALEVEVAERTKDLVRTIESLHVEMSERLKAEEELRTRERLLIQQSRLAAMGEMISNIAHQWRQPLNTLGLVVQRLPHFYDAGMFDREFLATSTREAMNLIRHMSDTIDDFRDFFRPDKERTIFNVKKAVFQAISLVDTGLRSHNIELVADIEGDPAVTGYPSQFAQVILNILFNARDALLERSVDNGRITIDSAWENDKLVLIIRDNAGGIPAEILDKVFDPYFTTKGPDRGTGIGLFMAKSIIEKSMGGRITACNCEEGAEFRIEI